VSKSTFAKDPGVLNKELNDERSGLDGQFSARGVYRYTSPIAGEGAHRIQ